MEALLIKIYKFNFIGCQNSIYAIQHFDLFFFCLFLPICCHYKAKKKLLMNFSLLYSKFWALAYTNKSVSGRKNAYHLILFSKILSTFFQKSSFDSIIYTYSFYYSLIFFNFVRGCIRFRWIQIHFYWCQQSCVPDTAIHVATFYWKTNS